VNKIKLFLIIGLILIVTGVAFADSNVTFTWDKNIEPDLAGYRLYQSATPDGQVVDGTSFVMEIPPEAGLYDTGIIPSLDPAKDAYTLISVPDGTWYWVLTAYDTQNNESGKSNEVSATVDSTPPGSPTILEVTAVVRVP